jgi:two-component sensor histidine kinase
VTLLETIEPSLEFLPEPAFLLDRLGVVRGANGPARRLLGEEVAGRRMLDLVVPPRETVEIFLRRARGSTAPLVGALTLSGPGGEETFRVYAARLSTRRGAATPCSGSQQAAEDAVRTVLHCRPVRDDRFALLTRRVRELDDQLRRRLQEKAALEEALAQNRTLLRELQHRVKNNIQLMMSLIRMSARGRSGAGVAEIVEAARLRLQAMASTQEAIYRSRDAGTVSTKAFLEELVEGIAFAGDFAEALDLDVEEVELESEEAHCLALIVNELVTNAGKYGLRDRKGRVRVSLAEEGSNVCLVVADDGPGMAAGDAASSGLILVRGLCRQIGGRFETVSDGGLTCRVEFAGRRAGRTG